VKDEVQTQPIESLTVKKGCAVRSEVGEMNGHASAMVTWHAQYVR